MATSGAHISIRSWPASDAPEKASLTKPQRTATMTGPTISIIRNRPIRAGVTTPSIRPKAMRIKMGNASIVMTNRTIARGTVRNATRRRIAGGRHPRVYSV